MKIATGSRSGKSEEVTDHYRDETERLEAEQAAFCASLADDGDNVLPGPDTWFKTSSWGTPAWGAPGYRYRRLLEYEASRDPPPEGARHMRMQADDYYRRAADAEERKQRQSGKKGKRPKLDPAAAPPEPNLEDFDRRWDGTLPSAIYVYRDEHKMPHTVVARWNLPGGDKEIRPYIWGEAANRAPGWVNQRHPNPILYRLPQVLQGVKDGKEIIFLEGEKDVDGAVSRDLEKHGYVFTTTLGGAMNNPRWNAWSDTDYSPVSGAHATLVPDPGGPGAAWCEGIAAQLRRLNGSCIRRPFASAPSRRIGTASMASLGVSATSSRRQCGTKRTFSKS